MQKIAQQISQRIDFFDLLRGYFVLVIVLDHLERWPGVFDWMTGQGRLWSSAAEGFFLISGIMIGLIRGHRAIDKPLKVVSKILIERGVVLYLWAVATTLLFVTWGMLWPYGGLIPPGLFEFQGEATAPNMLWQIFNLQYSYGWAGFLKFYAIYIMLSPLVIWLLRSGLWWVVLLGSASVWLYGLDQDDWWLSWQLLFYTGAVLGFYTYSIRDWWHGRTALDRRVLSAVIFSSSFIFLVLSVFWTFAWNYLKAPDNPIMSFTDYDIARRYVDPLFDRVSLQPLRLLVTALWFTSLILLFSRFEHQLKRFAGWLLMPFGQNSLYVYILHGLVVFALDLLLPAKQYILQNIIVQILVVALLWFAVKKQFLFKIIPR
ncbi:hypothetical protein CYG49_02400 [Candidatus Saccharibacteria bacterium]|nr:MAG: hypothetical protein CYG49_02400 [Candidatus Saccharibacteria bacterium]